MGFPCQTFVKRVRMWAQAVTRRVAVLPLYQGVLMQPHSRDRGGGLGGLNWLHLPLPPPAWEGGGGGGLRPISGDPSKGVCGTFGKPTLFNTATHQELLDCNHSRAHNFKKGMGRRDDANWCEEKALSHTTVRARTYCISAFRPIGCKHTVQHEENIAGLQKVCELKILERGGGLWCRGRLPTVVRGCVNLKIRQSELFDGGSVPMCLVWILWLGLTCAHTGPTVAEWL